MYEFGEASNGMKSVRNLMKIRSVVLEMFYAYRRTDGRTQGKPDRRSAGVLQTSLKLSGTAFSHLKAHIVPVSPDQANATQYTVCRTRRDQEQI
jgi:hypothetical protein